MGIVEQSISQAQLKAKDMTSLTTGTQGLSLLVGGTGPRGATGGPPPLTTF